MKLKYDDPRLTAYALGEMNDDEAREFEALLKEDPEAQREVDMIREAGQFLRQGLQAEILPELTAEQRQTIASEAGQGASRRGSFRLIPWFAAAASALLLGILLLTQRSGKDKTTALLPANAVDEEIETGEPQAVAAREQSASRTERQMSEQKEQNQAPATAKVEMEKAVEKIAQKGLGTLPAPVEMPQLAVQAEPKPVMRPIRSRDGLSNPRVTAISGAKKTLSTPREKRRLGLHWRDTSAVAKRAVKGKSLGVSLAKAERKAPLPESRNQGEREAYDRIVDNPFHLVRQDPLSTFSIDVDTASYANMRRFLKQNQLPPKDAVRIEEMVNYFLYDYPEPEGKHPFSVSSSVAQCPWAPKHRLARIALKGKSIAFDQRPASNLVFLLDVSGSMSSPNKLPLLKNSMKMLIDQLGENDRVSIVVYAGAAGLVLPSTSCDQREKILAAVEQLNAGGSTAGGAGIKLAYKTAVENFIKGGINRVILGTDGDFNVGVSSNGELTRLIEEKAKSGVFLTILGFGMGNYQDSKLELLSNKGNGSYAYIDSLKEAKKVMIEQIGGTLNTIAKDVKIQIEFNPANVNGYRLIGYENRILQHQDFNDDTKDAGEIGAGLTVTALYEIVPKGVEINVPGVDPLRYQVATKTAAADSAAANEMMTVKLRYKQPTGTTSTLIEQPVAASALSAKEISPDFAFAASVAAFGMILRDSPYKGEASFALVDELARPGAAADRSGYRKEFLELVQKAKQIKQ